MTYSAAILDASRLAEIAPLLASGAHMVVFAPDERAALEARRYGFTLRDTLLVYSPGRAEVAYLLRKTLGEPTVAENLMKHGTGGINIERCRVSWGAEKPSQEEWNRLGSGGSGESTTAFLQHTAIREYYAKGLIPVPSGRWPTNLVVIHGPGCRLVGTRSVSSRTREFPEGDEGRADTGTWRFRPTEATARGYGDNGEEEIPLWQCSEDCCVPDIDLQSGYTVSNPRPRHNRVVGLFPHSPQESFGYADKGGGSRFFPQFASRAELLDWIEKLIKPEGSEIFR